MLGSALGISPSEVNEAWLKTGRFQMGVAGVSKGRANDLWQIRKYETKQIAGYAKGEQPAPYKTAVIVRELLYDATFLLYLCFEDPSDYETVAAALRQPAWALSLGREDELIQMEQLTALHLEEQEELRYAHTVLPYDINTKSYRPVLEGFKSSNLLQDAPRTVSLPVSFNQKKGSEVRTANHYQLFSFIGGLPVIVTGEKGFYDADADCAFQIF